MLPDDRQDRWLDTAVSGIRFGPDQAEVRAELEGHIEDKTMDLQRIFPDISPEEARERALAGMGDPEELKVSLAKIHRPWLGYLWTVSRLLLIPVILSVLIASPLTLFIGLTDWEARDVILGSPETAWSRETASRSTPMARDTSWVRVDDCLLTMGRVWLVAPETEGEDYALQVELKLFSPLIWVEDHYFSTRVSATDSDGNYYAAIYTWDWSNEPERRVSGASTSRQSILPRLFQERYVLKIIGVDPDVEWVRLDYDRMGRSFSLRAEREGA